MQKKIRKFLMSKRRR